MADSSQKLVSCSNLAKIGKKLYSLKRENTQLEKELEQAREQISKLQLNKGISEKRKLIEDKWIQGFNDLTDIIDNVCGNTYKLHIFGGILNKIINPTFEIEKYDIDMFFTSVYGEKLCKINFRNQLNRLKRVGIIYDLEINDEPNAQIVENEDEYGSILNAPGLNNLIHAKAKTRFNGITEPILLDFINGQPNADTLDSPVSNLQFDIIENKLSLRNNNNINLIETIMNIRHKKAPLIWNRLETGTSNMTQAFLMLSRQKKYILQGWDVKNIIKSCKVEDDFSCACCLRTKEELTNEFDVIELQCSHKFCQDCLREQIKSNLVAKDKCPMCRTKLGIKI